MTRTSNIRINELARELEIKAGEILAMLPEVGVEGPKTHSSSVDSETAVKVRVWFGAPQLREAVPEAKRGPVELDLPPPEASSLTPNRPSTSSGTGKALPSIRSGAPIAGGGFPLRPPVQALRPPLKQGGDMVAPPAVSPPVHASAPSAAPSEPSIPAAPARPTGTPVKPIPAETGDKGTPVAGPRAPLAHPSVAPRLAAKRAGGQPTPPLRPIAPTARRAATRSPARPASRPLVPPGGTPSPTPRVTAKPAARRAPARPMVVPGKPIYQRPRQVGPVPGMPTPRPGGGAQPGMPRPMHPVGRPGFAPGGPRPGFDPRRGPRPGPRQIRDREAEREEKLLRRQASKAAQAPPVAVNKEITVSEGMTLKELAEKLGIKANVVIKTLVDRGLFATINQTLDVDTIKDLCKHFGATTTEVTFEEEALQEVESAEEVSDLTPRAPVVTVMGHVDHGKTSLLDAIRETNVAEREAGGITQAIGAYQVSVGDRQIAFIDTPGHEAFTSMRARGAGVTDIVVLVVAADDGVMPQTLEAIDHAKAAEVPIVVAINKIDKAGSEADRVKQQLADRGLLPEEWGGDTVMVPVSAQTKENLGQLLEMVLLVSDLKEPKANPSRPGVGTVLEAKLERGQGPVATVLVQNGTLRVGDYFVVGSVFGKVRALVDDRGNKLKEAPPSSAVVVLGLDGTPEPGDSFQVVTDTEKAKKIVEFRENKAREQAMAKTSRLSLDQFQEQLRKGEVEELSLLIKADVQGSVEVLSNTLDKLSNEQVRVRIIRAGVGAISKSDVLLATAANAIIIGFNVRPERTASTIAEQEKVDIRLYTVIYELIDEVKRAMAGLLDPVTKETFHGRVDVLEIFHVSKVGTVAGSRVEEGRITRKSEVRLLRDNVVVYTGRVASLRRFKDEASEVRSGQECGVGLENYNDVKQGDVIEAFETEQVAQELLA